MTAEAGIELGEYFDAAGPSNGPAIVLVHGAVVTRKIWIPQLRDLSDRYRVIAPDLPGHGSLAAVPFSLDVAAETVAEVIRGPAAGRAVVIGLSLGGYVAIEIAHRHPEMVAGLVLSGCTVNFTGVLGGYLKVASALLRWGWWKQTRARAEEKTRRLFPPALADVADAQLLHGVYPEALAPAFAELAGRDFLARLSTYSGPGLILNGERDGPSRRGEGKFAKALRNGRVEIIAGAGHASNLDDSAAYTAALRRFVG